MYTLAGTVILGFVLLLYIIGGGIVFHFLERENPVKVRQDTDEFHKRLTSTNVGCLKREELMYLLDMMKEFVEGGYTYNISENGTLQLDRPLSDWDYYTSFYFSATIVTTIGYGNMAPGSNAGKIFCMFYAIIGIPICLVFLARIGKRFSQLNNFIASKVNIFPQGSFLDDICDAIMVMTLGLVCGILLPAGIFSLIEQWDYIASVYYSVITLSTVGLGDYVAGMTEQRPIVRGIYRITCAVWIFFGLAWFAAIINVMQETIARYYASKIVQDAEAGEEEEEVGLDDALIETKVQAPLATPEALDKNSKNKKYKSDTEEI